MRTDLIHFPSRLYVSQNSQMISSSPTSCISKLNTCPRPMDGWTKSDSKCGSVSGMLKLRKVELSWCYVMDNWGGHETQATLPGVKIVYLPPRSTAKHHPLDLGIIANARMRYRSAVPAATIDVLESRSSSNHGLKMNYGHGKWGLMEGQLPQVGNAMNLFNQSWDSIHRVSIMKCWIQASVSHNLI